MPSDIRTLLESALVQHRGGDLAGAALLYRQVLEVAPHNADALHLLGLVLHAQGDSTSALTLIEEARTRAPRNADIVYNLGRVCLALHDWPMAAEANRAALALQRGMGAAWCNLGIAQVHLGAAADGEASIRTALVTGADNAASFSALGLALHHQAKEAEARVAWETALARDPLFAEARFNLATAHLRDGDFARGWPLFASRAQADPASFATLGPLPPHIPRWRGEPLADKRVLIWGEQGLGDQILFASLLPELAAQHVTLVCAPRLVPVFARAFPAMTVQPPGNAYDADVVLPLGELGTLLRPDAAAFKSRAPLQADSLRKQGLRARYRGWSQFRPLVGLSWHSRRATLGALKSLPLPAMAAALKDAKATFVSLQYGETEADLAAAGRAGLAVHHDPEIDATHDLDALAAQIAAMDLVITVSNTTAHLAGALGVPVWTLAPAGGGSLWYWFTPTLPWRASAWYPHMRIYAQDAPGKWETMLQRVKNDLTHFCTGAV